MKLMYVLSFLWLFPDKEDKKNAKRKYFKEVKMQSNEKEWQSPTQLNYNSYL